LFEAADDIEKLGVACGCGWMFGWRGDDCGEPLEREPSDEEECIDCNYSL